MPLILHTRLQLSRLMGFVVLIAFIFLPRQNVYSQYTAPASYENTVSCQDHIPDDIQTVIDVSTGHSDVHARRLTKVKVKCLAKKINAAQTSDDRYTGAALITTTPLPNSLADITKPAYYLFLFRYTLF